MSQIWQTSAIWCIWQSLIILPRTFCLQLSLSYVNILLLFLFLFLFAVEKLLDVNDLDPMGRYMDITERSKSRQINTRYSAFEVNIITITIYIFLHISSLYTGICTTSWKALPYSFLSGLFYRKRLCDHSFFVWPVLQKETVWSLIQ